MRYLVIVNPKAGVGGGVPADEYIRGLLAAAGLEQAEVVPTTGPGIAADLAYRAAPDFDVVVSVGGDGTLHEVVNGLGRARFGPGQRPVAALGIVPMGTGNDFVKSIGIPRDPAQAIDVLRKDRRRRIDLARANAHFFVNDLSIGYGALVVHDMADRRTLSRYVLRGRLAYTVAGLRRLTYKPPERSCEVDGRTYTGRYFELHIANGAFCGGGISFAPHARPDDGRLEVTLIEAMPLTRLVPRLLQVRRARLEAAPGVHFLGGACVRVRGELSLPAYLDGEALTFKADPEQDDATVEVTVLPGALEVVTGPPA